jgi:hypothetical protein
LEPDENITLVLNTGIHPGLGNIDVYVYIVLMLDKAGQQERWGIVKEGGKGRREKKH